MARAAPTAVKQLTRAVNQAGDDAQRHAGPWVERFARAGYVAKGVLYLLVGLLAFQAAVGWGGQVGDSKNALASLQGGTFGTPLLWAIGFGLVGYTVWQLFRAALDPEHEGRDGKGVITRVGFAISGLIHASLAFWLFTHLLTNIGGGSGGSGDGAEDLVARVLEWGVAGRAAVAIAGLCIVGFAVHQLIKAWRVDLSDQLSLSHMSAGMRKAAIFTGRVGTAARGVVFGIIGWFTLLAAWRSSSGEAGGIGEALQSVGGFGWVLLGVTAAGLAAYGVFMFIKAKYRRINVG